MLWFSKKEDGKEESPSSAGHGGDENPSSSPEGERFTNLPSTTATATTSPMNGPPNEQAVVPKENNRVEELGELHHEEGDEESKVSGSSEEFGMEQAGQDQIEPIPPTEKKKEKVIAAAVPMGESDDDCDGVLVERPSPSSEDVAVSLAVGLAAESTRPPLNVIVDAVTNPVSQLTLPASLEPSQSMTTLRNNEEISVDETELNPILEDQAPFPLPAASDLTHRPSVSMSRHGDKDVQGAEILDAPLREADSVVPPISNEAAIDNPDQLDFSMPLQDGHPHDADAIVSGSETMSASTVESNGTNETATELLHRQEDALTLIAEIEEQQQTLNGILMVQSHMYDSYDEGLVKLRFQLETEMSVLEQEKLRLKKVWSKISQESRVAKAVAMKEKAARKEAAVPRIELLETDSSVEEEKAELPHEWEEENSGLEHEKLSMDEQSVVKHEAQPDKAEAEKEAAAADAPMEGPNQPNDQDGGLAEHSTPSKPDRPSLDVAMDGGSNPVSQSSLSGNLKPSNAVTGITNEEGVPTEENVLHPMSEKHPPHDPPASSSAHEDSHTLVNPSTFARHGDKDVQGVENLDPPAREADSVVLNSSSSNNKTDHEEKLAELRRQLEKEQAEMESERLRMKEEQDRAEEEARLAEAKAKKATESRKGATVVSVPKKQSVRNDNHADELAELRRQLEKERSAMETERARMKQEQDHAEEQARLAEAEAKKRTKSKKGAAFVTVPKVQTAENHHDELVKLRRQLEKEQSEMEIERLRMKEEQDRTEEEARLAEAKAKKATKTRKNVSVVPVAKKQSVRKNDQVDEVAELRRQLELERAALRGEQLGMKHEENRAEQEARLAEAKAQKAAKSRKHVPIVTVVKKQSDRYPDQFDEFTELHRQLKEEQSGMKNGGLRMKQEQDRAQEEARLAEAAARKVTKTAVVERSKAGRPKAKSAQHSTGKRKPPGAESKDRVAALMTQQKDPHHYEAHVLKSDADGAIAAMDACVDTSPQATRDLLDEMLEVQQKLLKWLAGLTATEMKDEHYRHGRTVSDCVKTISVFHRKLFLLMKDVYSQQFDGKEPFEVFLCYCDEDRDSYAFPLVRHLTHHGVRVFVGTVSTLPGDRSHRKLMFDTMMWAAATCKVFWCVASPACVTQWEPMRLLQIAQARFLLENSVNFGFIMDCHEAPGHQSLRAKSEMNWKDFMSEKLSSLKLYSSNPKLLEHKLPEFISTMQKSTPDESPNARYERISDSFFAAKSAIVESELLLALPNTRSVWGDDHPCTLSLVNILALAMLKQGKLSESEPLFREALAGRSKTLGNHHPETLSSMCNLAAWNEAAGRIGECEKLYSWVYHEMALNHPDRVFVENKLMKLAQEEKEQITEVPIPGK